VIGDIGDGMSCLDWEVFSFLVRKVWLGKFDVLCGYS
jgi:hypothetical protein